MDSLSSAYSRILAVAERQGGVLTRAQMLRAGVTNAEIDALAQDPERLHAAYLDTFDVFDLEDTFWEDTHRTFHLLQPGLFTWEKSAPQDASRFGAVSHFSAAELYGCTVLPIELHLTAPTEHSIPGVHVHTAPLPAHDLTTIEGLPVTTLERTTRDLGALQMDGEHRARWMDFLVYDMGWSVENVLACVGPQAAEQSIPYFEAAA